MGNIFVEGFLLLMKIELILLMAISRIRTAICALTVKFVFSHALSRRNAVLTFLFISKGLIALAIDGVILESFVWRVRCAHLGGHF